MNTGWLDSPDVGSILQQRGCRQVLPVEFDADSDADALYALDALDALDALVNDDADVAYDDSDDYGQVTTLVADDADVGDEGSALAAVILIPMRHLLHENIIKKKN